MEQPSSFVAQGESGLVCHLHRSLYGLKQSREPGLKGLAQSFGMVRSEANHSIFYHHSP